MEELKRIIKYTFSAGSSFLLDLGLFALFEWIFTAWLHWPTTTAIIIATIAARILSSIYNYLVNSRAVFKHRGRKSIILYFLLVLIQMTVSAGVVSFLESLLEVVPVIIKFGVDIVIFVVNYIVQKEVVFK